MANSLTAFNPEYWAKEMQRIRFKENVAIALANTEYRNELKDGDTLNKPYRTTPKVQTYTKGSDITASDLSSTNEYLSVDTAKVVAFYVDDIDKIQNKWDAAKVWAADSQRLLNNVLDQAIVAEYSNAGSYVDEGDIGGTAGTYITLSTSNVQDIFAAAARKLDGLQRPVVGRFALIGPRILERLRLYISGKDTSVAHIVGDNGKVGARFGFELFFSNNLPFTATLSMATQVTEGDTVTIAGVRFTFNATPSGEGSVDIGGDVDVSRANLTAAVNDSGTVGTTYIQLAAKNRRRLILGGIAATNNDTANTMAITGYGDISTAETFTDVTDCWTASTVKSHALFGVKGATDLVVQKSPNIEFRLAEKKLGRYVYPWMLFGKKTFAEYTDDLVDVRIKASGWTN